MLTVFQAASSSCAGPASPPASAAAAAAAICAHQSSEQLAEARRDDAGLSARATMTHTVRGERRRGGDATQEIGRAHV